MKTKSQIGIYISVLLLLAVSMPILGLYNKAALWNNLPVSLWVLFGLWALVLALMGFLSRSKDWEG